MKASTRYFILFYGFFEIFVFSGNIFGWNSLQEMLFRENVYGHLCKLNETNNALYDGSNRSVIIGRRTNGLNVDSISTDSNAFIQSIGRENLRYLGCDSQKRMLNLAFTIGVFSLGSSGFIWGMLLDRWGLRCVRLIVNVLLTTSTVLLSLTGEETSYFIFPSLILMSVVGTPIRMSNIQVANLFPSQKATIITLYSGASVASSAVFVLIKYAYMAGFSWVMSCLLLVVISLVMLPITLLVLPASRIEGPPDRKASLLESINKIKDVDTFVPEYAENNLKSKIGPDITERDATENYKNFRCSSKVQIPLERSLFSSSYLMHVFWYCTLLLMAMQLVGDLNLWSERSSKDPSEGEIFGDFYGLLQLSGIILAPLAGIFVDWRIARASKEPDPEKQQLKIQQSCFWPMIFTTVLALASQISGYFDNPDAIVVAIVCTTIFRTFAFANGDAYLRIRFPLEHFGLLLGILYTTLAVCDLFQFPLYVWETMSEQSPLHVNIFNNVFLIVASLHPLLLLVTPWQIKHIQKESRYRNRNNANNYSTFHS